MIDQPVGQDEEELARKGLGWASNATSQAAAAAAAPDSRQQGGSAVSKLNKEGGEFV